MGTGRKATRSAPAAPGAEDFDMVVRHARHLARQAGAAGGEEATVDRAVKAAALRRRRELAALRAGGGSSAD